MLVLLMSSPIAAQVTRAWNAWVSMVDEYWLYDGTARGTSTARIDVGPVTRYPICEAMVWQALCATSALREGKGLWTMKQSGDA